MEEEAPMYAKLVKLRYTWTAIALLIIIILISIWYSKPVDIYGLDSALEVEAIEVSLTKVHEGSTDTLENRTVTFQKGDEGFDEALDKMESLELIRPARNLMPLPLIKQSDRFEYVENYDYRIQIELEGGEDHLLTLVCDIDNWKYRKASYDADLPLKTTENTETAKNLGDFFWELSE